MKAKPKSAKKTSRKKETGLNADAPHITPPQQVTAEEALLEHQAMLATAEEVAKIGSWKWDLRTQKVTWSDGMFRLFGVEPEGFDGNVNRVIAERVHPDDIAILMESNRRVLEESSPAPLSYRIILPNGMERTVWAQGKMIQNEEGETIALTGYVQDITERVRAERKIIQLQRLYATLSQVNQMIVRVKDEHELYQTICDVVVQFGEFQLAWVGLLDESTGDVRPTAATGAHIDMWPFPTVNIRGGPFQNTVIARAIETSHVMTGTDIQADANFHLLHDIVRTHGFRSLAVVPFRLRERTIGVLNLLSRERGYFEAEEELRLLEEMGLDISFALDTMANEQQRKKAEERLRESEERLRLSLGAAKQGLYDLNVQTGSATVNRDYVEMLGYDYETFVETNQFWNERLHPDDREMAAQAYQDYINGLRPEYRVEFRQRTRDGSWKWILSLGRVIEYDAEGRPLRMLGTHTDITEHKQAEAALRESEEKYRAFFENSLDAILLTRPDGSIQAANPAACRALGRTEEEICKLGRNGLVDTSDPRLAALLEQRAKFGKAIGELTMIRSDGSRFPVEMSSVLFTDKNGDLRTSMIFRDISQRKQAEDALRRSEALLSEAQQIGHIGHWEWTAESGKIIGSDEFFRIFDIPANDHSISLSQLASLLSPGEPEALNKLDTSFFTGGTDMDYEFNIHLPGGRERWLHQQAKIMYGANGEPVRLVGTIQDITDRKHMEQELRDKQKFLEAIVEISPDIVYLYQPQQQKHIYINRDVESLLGYSREDMMNHGAAPIIKEIHPDDLPNVFEHMEKLLHAPTQEIYPLEYRIRGKDGTYLWFYVREQVYQRDERGTPIVIFGVVQDVTERKKFEEALKRGEHVLRLFVEHSPASIAMFDRDMRYIVASRRFLIDYRLGEQNVTGRSHYEIFPEIPERWREIHRRCLAGAIEKADEDPFPREDGSLDWVRWEIRPWYEESESIGGIILFSEVITERKQAQDELRLLNLELEQRVQERTMELSQANRAKDEFLANMSHELRTPLNTILGLSETLLEQRRGPLNEKQVHSIDLILSSGRHLLGLINDILEVSKIEAGKLQLHPSQVSIKELCESSLSFIRELALKKRISVTFNQNAPILKIQADPQRIKQILINLLINAVKFTADGGSVSLDVSTNAEQDQIRFSVTDTGIGIAHEDLKKLFTPFTQLDSTLARQYTGTGLGLALVQKLTDLHGGSVQVESEAGHGSRFTIILPVFQSIHEEAGEDARARPIHKEPAANPSRNKGIILLADDNEINSEMLADYLETHEYTVLRAKDGEEVLQKASQVQPDIILMDIQMPKMDGLEAMRQLRMETRFQSTPIVALTALAMPGDRERCIEAGANEYLSKPVNLRMMLELIKRMTGHKD